MKECVAVAIAALTAGLLMFGAAAVDAQWTYSNGANSGAVSDKETPNSSTIVSEPPPAQDVTIQNAPPPPLPANMPALIIGAGGWRNPGANAGANSFGTGIRPAPGNR